MSTGVSSFTVSTLSSVTAISSIELSTSSSCSSTSAGGTTGSLSPEGGEISVLLLLFASERPISTKSSSSSSLRPAMENKFKFREFGKKSVFSKLAQKTKPHANR